MASSRIAAFENSDRAIKIVCEGGTGGGWFQEGISEETLQVLQSIARDGFSPFDYACLVWWARNRIFIEQKLARFENVLHIRFERLLDGHLQRLFEFIGLEFDDRFTRFVRPPRPRREYPPVRPIVQQLCEELEAQLETGRAP